MIFILEAGWKSSFSTVGERIFLGLTMTLVGIAIVTVVLVLISLMVTAISRVINGKKETVIPLEKTPVETKSVKSAIPRNIGDPENGSEPEEAVVAAISAALSYLLSSEGKPYAGFKIRNIRRV